MEPSDAEAAVDEALKLKTEFDTFRDSKGAATADVRLLVRNESKTLELSSPELADATLQALHLSEKVPPGHEEGFYFKKGKGKMEGRLVLQVKFDVGDEGSLTPQGTLTFSWPMNNDVESAVPLAVMEYNGRVEADVMVPEASLCELVNCTLGGCVFAISLAPNADSPADVVFSLQELGYPPKLFGYDWDALASLPRGRSIANGIDPLLSPTDPKLGPPVWAVVSGTLPPGLSLDLETGSINGIPTEAGDFSCVISVSNFAGESTTSLYISVGLTEEEKRKALEAATDTLVQEARGALQLPCSPSEIEASYARALRQASSGLADNLKGVPRIEIDTWLMELLGVMSKLVEGAKKVNADLIGKRPGVTIRVPRDRISIQEALHALPPSGGIVQIASGIYKEDIVVTLPAILMGPEEVEANAALIEGTLTIADGGENSVLRRLEVRARRLGAPALAIRSGAPRIEACDVSADAGPSVVVSGCRTNPRIVRNLVRYPPHGPGGIKLVDGAKARIYDNVLRTPGPEHIEFGQQGRNIISTPEPIELARQQQAQQQQQYMHTTGNSWSNSSFGSGGREIHSREAQSQGMTSTITSVWQHRVCTPSTDGLRRTLSDLGRSLAAQPREHRVRSAPGDKSACRAAARSSSQCNLPRPGKSILKCKRFGDGLRSSISFEVPSPTTKRFGGVGRPSGQDKESQIDFRPF